MIDRPILASPSSFQPFMGIDEVAHTVVCEGDVVDANCHRRAVRQRRNIDDRNSVVFVVVGEKEIFPDASVHAGA